MPPIPKQQPSKSLKTNASSKKKNKKSTSMDRRTHFTDEPDKNTIDTSSLRDTSTTSHLNEKV